MTQERAPDRTQSLWEDEAETSSWELARTRLANPEQSRTCWLATTRPDGGPHLMPVIGFWIDDAMHILAGEGSQKARNIAADGRCVIATGSTTLPSLDIVIEGRAEPITGPGRRSTRCRGSTGRRTGPSRPTGDKVDGPNAPTAGPPPYTFFRIVPSRVFGFPGMTGMEQFDPEDLPKPTRWDFDGS